jgi:hypothetical protein
VSGSSPLLSDLRHRAALWAAPALATNFALEVVIAVGDLGGPARRARRRLDHLGQITRLILQILSPARDLLMADAGSVFRSIPLKSKGALRSISLRLYPGSRECPPRDEHALLYYSTFWRRRALQCRPVLHRLQIRDHRPPSPGHEVLVIQDVVG